MGKLAMLIDDDEVTHLLTTRILNMKFPDLPVKNFMSGKEAIGFLSAQGDRGETEIIIFLDLNMPEMDGWEFMDILEEKVLPFKIRVLVLTSSVDDQDRKKCGDYRSIGSFISKPLSLQKAGELGIQ